MQLPPSPLSKIPGNRPRAAAIDSRHHVTRPFLKMTDSELDRLIDRSKRSDMDAFGEIVRHFERPLRSWIASHCPPGVQADEIAQETFIAAHRRLDQFTTGTRFHSWLFTIARYQLMTETTRRRRIADYHTRFGPELIDRELERRADTRLPEEVTDRLEALRHCLGELGERGRELIRWRYDDAIPLREMADRTRRSEGAIKKNLFTLRQKLQECVEGRLAIQGGAA